MLTPLQLEARRHGVGGSDAAAVLGLSPYRTPLDVFMEKTGEIDPPDLRDVEAVHWGNVLEDVVAREFAAREGVKVRRVNRTLRHQDPRLDFMLAHIDRQIVGEHVGLEIKTTSPFVTRDLGRDGSDQIPDQWLLQVAHYLEVTGWDAFYVAALVGGQRLRIYRIERDPDLADMIVEKETWFWRECVEKRMPPPPTTVDDLALLYAADNGGTVETTPAVSQALRDLKTLKATRKELETRIEELEFEVKAHLGEAATLVDADGYTLATWKSQTATRLDQTRLKAEAPDVYAQYTTESSYRVLRIK
jgi:putative phage-type endonuclease